MAIVKIGLIFYFYEVGEFIKLKNLYELYFVLINITKTHDVQGSRGKNYDAKKCRKKG